MLAYAFARGFGIAVLCLAPLALIPMTHGWILIPYVVIITLCVFAVRRNLRNQKR